jgi:hypothetical protein
MADQQRLLFGELEQGGGDGVASATPSEADQPIDAIVYEAHPALCRFSPPTDAFDPDYPYGPPISYPPATHEAGRLSDGIGSLIHAADGYFLALQRPPDFAVPKTFGMSAIFGIMTALALLFAALRWLNAFPEVYFFLSGLAIAICVAQMAYGKAPRLASVVAGGLILPLVFIVAAVLSGDSMRIGLAILIAIPLLPCGALLGYLTGTCAAGIFLVMNYLEIYLQGVSFSQSKPTT